MTFASFIIKLRWGSIKGFLKVVHNIIGKR